jgi:hypothetical protein
MPRIRSSGTIPPLPISLHAVYMEIKVRFTTEQAMKTQRGVDL